ncbi:ABC transporter permease [Peribacillus psychrosaccharolyticus]|uniref:ABC transporter permease n=1 Tax=Peribacillus psychrosaccharolyticus TaxID=1407 RepID=A0A974S236_PERPY|nr:FtsX-like permease family protein [Peribacillus psychrosaccharolyticus]MEC2055827.1 FtsX-like permease family protein [Peribacillus psychrosaccharolyticus]MED3743002.1 FtsX-like permease family protein [Peribacillus psychrosaccharolyticus]QQT00940.1 ABC transporter permease [Peribacillus psychrosaccharolyticus]
MNIVNKVTVRHMKQNKKRTLVTILGVIISAAMITAVATLAVSFMELMQRQTIANDGEWHVQYKNVNKKQLKAIKEDEKTKSVIISNDLGYAKLEGSQNENKPFLFIKEYSPEAFKQFPIQLSKGRWPKKANEVIISEEVAANANVIYKMGDAITLNVGERLSNEGAQVMDQDHSLEEDNGEILEEFKPKKAVSYTVVGFIERPTWEPAWAPGYTLIAYKDEQLMGEDDTVQASVVLNKVTSSLYKHAGELAKNNKIDSHYFHSDLLRYYGVTNNDYLRTTLYSLVFIIMAVIIIGSVSLIYNAFAISVSERTRHLGMLSSVGATKRQKRNSVFFEGFLIGLISIPLGVISGLIGIGITFSFINSIIQSALGVTEKLTVTVTPFSLLLASGVSALTIFISTLLPAIKASKISAIDSIRQSTDIKLTRKSVKTSKIVRRIFGIEAEFALKNLKRNKRRYQATIFSLVISIFLFLVVSFYTTSLKKSVELNQSGLNYDIQVYMDSSNADQFVKPIVSLEDVTEFSEMTELSALSWVSQESMPDLLKEIAKNEQSIINDKYLYYMTIHSLKEDALKAYAKEVGVAYDRLVDTEKKGVILIDTMKYEEAGTNKKGETKSIYKKEGETLDLRYNDEDTGEEKELHQVEIAALTDKNPMGIVSTSFGELHVIASEQVMNTLIKKQANNSYQVALFLNSENPIKTQQEIEKMKANGISIFNLFQNRQRDEQMILLMSVFSYGFIVLITAISIANIFNTISTSISLRKREFAMLKSVGMTPKGFNKMIHYESVFYGIKSLLYGIPLSIIVMILIHRATQGSFTYSFTLPWASLLYCFAAVFVIVSSAMIYSSSKVKKENIIDGLKQESI